MKYVLAPTNKDIMHYAKGTESKSHGYISRVWKNGKWVYTYAKNRLRGNKVTNKNGKEQYSPNVNKASNFKNKYGVEALKEMNKGSKGRHSGYEPNITTWGAAGDRTLNFEKGKDGIYRELNNNHNKNSHDKGTRDYQIEKGMYKNTGTPDNQYSPNDKRSKVTNKTSNVKSSYSPTVKNNSRNQYTPNEKTTKKTVTNKSGTSYTAGQKKSDKEKKKNKGKVVLKNMSGGSHSF